LLARKKGRQSFLKFSQQLRDFFHRGFLLRRPPKANEADGAPLARRTFFPMAILEIRKT
jgi:hypothetical protein